MKTRRSERSVVIADDQPLVAEALAAVIAAPGTLAIALVITDAIKLLDVAKRDPPALVVIDAAMAQSFWVARWLAVHSSGTKVIFLDEAHQDAHLRRARECGAAGYATKSDTRQQFTARIGQVMAGQEAFPGGPPAGIDRHSDRLMPAADRAAHLTPAMLTSREIEVLGLLAEGLRVSDCARVLSISPNTVDNHKARIMRKLGMHKTVELTRFAIRHGIVSGV